MALDEAAQRYLAGQGRGRLATIGRDGTPQNKPVGFTYNAVLGTIDITGFSMETSAKFRNVGIDPNVAFVVDDAVSEGAAGMRFIEIRGHAQQVLVEPPPAEGLSPHIIRIHPQRVVSMNIDPDRPGFQTWMSKPLQIQGQHCRPNLAVSNVEAGSAVDEFVSGLQDGHDRRDADLLNHQFASDVIWGSPYGALIEGYEQLHPIHVRFQTQQGRNPHARYEVRHILAVSEDVLIAHIARLVLGPDDQPVSLGDDSDRAFSELAMYVLVRREGRWWLAAGQNTPMRPGGAVAAEA